MALLACWVLYPAILLLLAHGAGTLIARGAGRELPAGIRLPCGLALIVAVLDLATRTTTTATLAVPAAVAVGVAGLALALVGHGRPTRATWDLARWRLSGDAIAGAVTYAVYAAPIVFSGQATWAGYIKLDDTATWLSLVDRALTHGRTLAGLPISTYRDVLANYLTVGYPIGSFLPVGLGHELVGQDSAWLTDPWMATMAVTLTLALVHVARRAVPDAPHWLPAAIGSLAAQGALLYGYYLWGGMKELAGAFLLGAFAVSAPLMFEGERRLRATLPAIVVLWALVAALSPGGLVWAGPGGVLTVVVTLVARRRLTRPTRGFLAVAGVGVLALALGLYLVSRPGGFVEHFRGVLTGGDQLGNLIAPLHFLQLVGIWPAKDFRLQPAQLTITHGLIGIALAGALVGLVGGAWRSRLELLLYGLGAIAGAALVDGVASPWLGGKALATASPAIPLLALVGAALLAGRPSRIDRAVGIAVAVLVGGGIIWSNVLGYDGVSLAPREQYAELADIGQRIAGQGPTLMTEYSPYGARHFLRAGDPESASELRTRLDLLTTGAELAKGGTADIDAFQLQGVLQYRTIVLQRSPTESRPPSPYQLTYEDRWWQVWQRPQEVTPTVITHMSLGDSIAPGAVADCSSIKALAQQQGVATLIAAPVTNPVAVAVSTGTYPASWGTGTSFLAPTKPGVASIPVTVPTTGRYSVWLGGSIQTPTTMAVDGHKVGSAEHDEQEAAQYVDFGDITLTAGAHTVQLRHSRGLLAPGTGGPADELGPLILRHDVPTPALLRVPIARARELCGRVLDWVEGVS